MKKIIPLLLLFCVGILIIPAKSQVIEPPSIYVSPTLGVDAVSNGLTEQNPVRTIGFAISRAIQTNIKQVKIHAGTYQEQVTIVNGIHLIGGFGDDWVYDPNNNIVVIVGPSTGNTVAVSANNINTTTYITDVRINAANGALRDTYGIHIQNSTGLILQRVTVFGGNGRPGANGTPGSSANQFAAGNGQPGGNGDEISSLCDDTNRGAGGIGAAGLRGGFNGGAGGTADTDCNGFPFSGNLNARPGLAGSGPFGGPGGQSCSNGQLGSDGFNGSIGPNGSPGNSSLVNLQAFWGLQGDGVNGGLGGDGTGGSGGGGSGGCDEFIDAFGAGGGGGGQGGARAPSAGSGGKGGGSSFGLYVYNSNLRLYQCEITAGGGGAGGTGGNGGFGQPGGSGGPGGFAPDNIRGGNGGRGGHGGNSGSGGHGAGGHSIGVFVNDASTLTHFSSSFNSGSAGDGGGSGAPAGQSRDIQGPHVEGPVTPFLLQQSIFLPNLSTVDNCGEEIFYDAIASSGMPVTLTTNSPNATITGHMITFSAMGDVILEISVGGNDYYEPASTTATIHVDCIQSQTITFQLVGTKTVGDAPVVLVATSTSALPVAIALISGPANLSGNTLTITGAGEILLTASQAGNEQFAPANDVSQSITVLKATQVINFAPIPNQGIGVTVPIPASATSGLPVTYYVSGPAILSSNNLKTLAVGQVSVIATQNGNGNYDAAASVTASFLVTAANGNSITMWFVDVDGDTYGDGNTSMASIVAVPGFVQNNGDCNDNNASVRPGATEVEDGIDNDCDCETDEGFAAAPVADILISSLCSDNPSTSRRWSLTNPNSVPIAVEWEIVGSTQRSWFLIQPGNAVLTTNTVKSNLNTIALSWHDEEGSRNSVQRLSTLDKCQKSTTSSESLATQSDAKLNVFPNPASAMVTLEVYSTEKANSTLQVVSMNGIVHHAQIINLEPGYNLISQDVKKLSPGTYIIKVGSASARFVKEN